MSRFLPLKFSFGRHFSQTFATLFLLATTLMLVHGCGGSDAVRKPIVADPVADFGWGMERLERALHFRPSGTDGLRVIDRKLDHELFPPDDAHADYRASVTIITETAYLQNKRPGKKDDDEAEGQDEDGLIDDPLIDKSDEMNNILELSGVGSRVPGTIAPKIKNLNTKTKSVFELVFIDEQWQLTEKPEKKHEQLWFEYAFD